MTTTEEGPAMPTSPRQLQGLHDEMTQPGSGVSPSSGSAGLNLNQMTVVKLKALCKELGIKGVSKLNKAQLVRRLEDEHNAKSAVAPPATDEEAQPSATLQQQRPPSGVESAAAVPINGPSSELQSRQLPGDGSTSSSFTTAADKPLVTRDLLPESIERPVNVTARSSDNTPGTTTQLASLKKRPTTPALDRDLVMAPRRSTVFPTLTDEKHPPTTKTPHAPLGGAASSHLFQPLQQPKSSSSSPRPSLTRDVDRSLHLGMGVPENSPESDDHSPSQARTDLFRPSPKLGLASSSSVPHRRVSAGKSGSVAKARKSAASVLVKRPLQPSFQAPRPVSSAHVVGSSASRQMGALQRNVISRDLEGLPLHSFAPLNPRERGTRSERITHIRSHFLERAFINLDAHRRRPALTASNSVTTVTPNDDDATRLAFTGVDSCVYDLDNGAFLVALRWWVSRLHTMLCLGSGQEWSVHGGGTGLLGPDLATWPVVVNCKLLHSGTYLVTTRASEPAAAAAAADGGFRNHKRRKATNHDSAGSVTPVLTHSDAPAFMPTDDLTTHYITVGATGDIVGSSCGLTTSSSGTLPTQLQLSTYEGCAVRPDWHAFLTAPSHSGLDTRNSGIELTTHSTAHHLTQSQPHSPRDADASNTDLLALVRTKDTDAPFGISGAWRTRLVASNRSANTDVRRLPELEVAERAVLASCALKSFTGPKLDAAQMDAEWLNHATTDDEGGSASSRRKHKQVELYLPEPLQILSVHLLPAPAHPALAVVHRACGRSDYVLRETGQVVGDEDGGVAELWQGILGCDARGNEADVSAFWEGWEERVLGTTRGYDV